MSAHVLRELAERTRLTFDRSFCSFVDLVAVYTRGCAAYSTGDTTRLLQDIGIMRPHVFCSVPRSVASVERWQRAGRRAPPLTSVFPTVFRVLNRIYAAIMAQASGGGLKGEQDASVLALLAFALTFLRSVSRQPPQPRNQNQDRQFPSHWSLHPRRLRPSRLLEAPGAPWWPRDLLVVWFRSHFARRL